MTKIGNYVARLLYDADEKNIMATKCTMNIDNAILIVKEEGKTRDWNKMRNTFEEMSGKDVKAFTIHGLSVYIDERLMDKDLILS